MHAFQPLEF